MSEKPKPGRPRPKTKGVTQAIAVDETTYSGIKKIAIKYDLSVKSCVRRLVRIGLEVVEKTPIRLLE